MWQFEATFSEVIQRTPEIKSFRFDVHDRKDVTYMSGQFFFVTIKIDGREGVHHFTLSSSPTETEQKGFIEFTKRITSSEYSQALSRIKPGAWVKLRGADGDFVLPAEKQPLALLSGGIGITPLRSMLRYIVDKKLDLDVVLLYGNNDYETIAFRAELDEIAAGHKNIRIEYVLSGPNFPPEWKGKRGAITRDLVMEVIPDYQERLFYLSGPLRMVLALEDHLAAAKVPQERIKRDYFPGYD